VQHPIYYLWREIRAVCFDSIVTTIEFTCVKSSMRIKSNVHGSFGALFYGDPNTMPKFTCLAIQRISCCVFITTTRQSSCLEERVRLLGNYSVLSTWTRVWMALHLSSSLLPNLSPLSHFSYV
jgi:hypothetical protein